MFQEDKYIQIDSKTLEKINNIPEYYNRLQIAYEYIQKFNIQDQKSFYLYLQTKSLSEIFEDISYNDIEAFKRFEENPEYLEKVHRKLNEKNQSKKIIKIVKYMKKNEEEI